MDGIKVNEKPSFIEELDASMTDEAMDMAAWGYVLAGRDYATIKDENLKDLFVELTIGKAVDDLVDRGFPTEYSEDVFVLADGFIRFIGYINNRMSEDSLKDLRRMLDEILGKCPLNQM